MSGADDDEKRQPPQNTPIYPPIPPPSYEESSAGTTNNPNMPPLITSAAGATAPVGATVVAPALVTAGVPNGQGGIQFMTIPATRYDTMTSYQDEGGNNCIGAGSGSGAGPMQTVITTGIILDSPLLVKCPFCKATITTDTKAKAGCLSWIFCLGLTAIGCIYGCCLIPFCAKRLCDVQHTCPKCHNVIALYKRL